MKTPLSHLYLAAALFSTFSQVQAVTRLGRPMVTVELDEQKLDSHSNVHHKVKTIQSADIRDQSHLPRFLQSPVDVVLKALVDSFMPQLAEELQGTITDDLDPVILNYQAVEDIGSIDLVLNQTFCGSTNASGIIVYDLSNMTGMSQMTIERLELVSGSQDIDIPILGFFGADKATWSGIWEMEASFVQFRAASQGTLQTTFCNVTFEEIITGTSTVDEPRVVMRAFLEGETSNIYDFNDSTELTKVDIRSLTGTYTSAAASLGTFQDMATVDADGPMTEIAETGFADGGEIRQFVEQSLQDGINGQLPYSL